jgi:hypothetical protein
MDAVNIKAYPSNSQQMDAIMAFMKALNIKFEVAKGVYDIPEEHQQLVMQRFEQVRQNPDRLLDWDEAKKTLRS